MDNRYTKDQTALLFVDPYNDFLSDGGKLWPYVREAAAEVGLLDNLRAITAATRKAGILMRDAFHTATTDRTL